MFSILLLLRFEKQMLRKTLLRARSVLLGLFVGFCWFGIWHTLFLAPIYRLDQTTIRLYATVSDWPLETQYGYSVLVSPTRDYRGTTLLYLDEQAQTLRPGDEISIVTRLSVATHTFSGTEISFYTAKGILMRGQGYGLLTVTAREGFSLRHLPAYLSRLISDNITRYLPEDLSAIVLAITTGKRETLSKSFVSAMQRSGTSHMIAISGMHLAFLSSIVSFILGRRRRKTAFIIIPCVLLFMAVTGNTPSIMRAGVMIIMLHIAPLFHREGDSATSLALALFLILLQNPLACANIGFQLSFAAVAGILLISQRMQRFFILRFSLWKKEDAPSHPILTPVLSFICTAFSTTIGAMAFTVPLSALYFKSFSLISPLSNLFTLWAVAFIFCGGFFIGTLGALLPFLGALFAMVTAPFVRFLLFVLPLFANIPFGNLPLDSIYYAAWLVFFYLFIALCIVQKWKRAPIFIALFAAVTFFAAAMFHIRDYFRGDITFSVLNVGQGQSILIRSGDSLTLIDCGGDDPVGAGNAAANLLQSIGRKEIDHLVLTHCHADHANGIPTLLSRVRVGALYLPDLDNPSALEQEIIQSAQDNGVAIFSVSSLHSISLADANFLIFPPLGEKDVNERALSVLFTQADFSALITGDMGENEEATLVKTYPLSPVSVYVAGHHGSKTSSSEALLSAIKPQISVISVSADNHYGHPHQETLDALNLYPCEIYRTDQMGTITIHYDADYPAA